MPHDEVMDAVAAETTRMLRAAAQVGRYLADQRREALHRAALDSEARARAAAQAAETQRRLAQGVYQRALDASFWEQADIRAAATVYATATRFATVDPLAALAARTCVQQAASRWGADPDALDAAGTSPTPLTTTDLGAQDAQALAPAPNSGPDGPRLLDEAAAAQTAQVRADGAAAARAARQQEAATATVAAALEAWPQVTTVRVGATGQGPDARAAFQALDAAGRRVPEAEADLDQVTSLAGAQDAVTRHLAGRTLGRADLDATTTLPAAAARRPRPAPAPQERPPGLWDRLRAAARRPPAPRADRARPGTGPDDQPTATVPPPDDSTPRAGQDATTTGDQAPPAARPPSGARDLPALDPADDSWADVEPPDGEAPPDQDPGDRPRAVRDAPAQEAGPTAGREEARAWAWFTAHYDPRAVGAELLPYAGPEDLRVYAYATYSAMAAEGLDLDAPPPIRSLDGPLTGPELDARFGAAAQVADALGLETAAVLRAVDPRAVAPMARAWEIEQAGGWPDLAAWSFNVGCKGGQALDRSALDRSLADGPRLVGDPAPGTYTPLALRAAASEAAAAGMGPAAYLDRLQPLQRRALVATHVYAATGYEDSQALASRYRVAYAQARARAHPQEAQAPVATPTTQAQQTETPVATPAQPDPGTRPRASQDAPAQETRTPVATSTSTTPGRDPEARTSTQAQQAETPVATPARQDPGQAATTPGRDGAGGPWDSRQARDQWARGMLDAGLPPAAVRAARTGDLALHEPPHRAAVPHHRPAAPARAVGGDHQAVSRGQHP